MSGRARPFAASRLRYARQRRPRGDGDGARQSRPVHVAAASRARRPDPSPGFRSADGDEFDGLVTGAPIVLGDEMERPTTARRRRRPDRGRRLARWASSSSCGTGSRRTRSRRPTAGTSSTILPTAGRSSGRGSGGAAPAAPRIRGPFGNPIPGAYEGSHLGSIPAVARCTSIIVDELVAMPWKVYRGRDQLPTPDWIADPQALRLDGRVLDPGAVPEVRLSHVDFWASWLTDALWWGDGLIWAPNRDAAGAPRPPMALIHPFDWQFRERDYWVGDRQLPASELIHLRGPGPDHERPRDGRVLAVRGRARLHAHDQGLRALDLLLRRPVGLSQGEQRRADAGARGRALRPNGTRSTARAQPRRRAQRDDRLQATDVDPGRRGS